MNEFEVVFPSSVIFHVTLRILLFDPYLRILNVGNVRRLYLAVNIKFVDFSQIVMSDLGQRFSRAWHKLPLKPNGIRTYYMKKNIFFAHIGIEPKTSLWLPLYSYATKCTPVLLAVHRGNISMKIKYETFAK